MLIIEASTFPLREQKIDRKRKIERNDICTSFKLDKMGKRKRKKKKKRVRNIQKVIKPDVGENI